MQQSVQQLGRKMAILRGVVRVRTSERYLVTHGQDAFVNRPSAVRVCPSAQNYSENPRISRCDPASEPSCTAVVQQLDSGLASHNDLSRRCGKLSITSRTCERLPSRRRSASATPTTAKRVMFSMNRALKIVGCLREIVPRESENITAAESSAGLNAERH